LNRFTFNCKSIISFNGPGVNQSRRIDFVNTRNSSGGIFEIKENGLTSMSFDNGTVNIPTTLEVDGIDAGGVSKYYSFYSFILFLMLFPY